jgi:hypothetical protein
VVFLSFSVPAWHLSANPRATDLCREAARDRSPGLQALGNPFGEMRLKVAPERDVQDRGAFDCASRIRAVDRTKFNANRTPSDATREEHGGATHSALRDGK